MKYIYILRYVDSKTRLSDHQALPGHGTVREGLGVLCPVNPYGSGRTEYGVTNDDVENIEQQFEHVQFYRNF